MLQLQSLLQTKRAAWGAAKLTNKWVAMLRKALSLKRFPYKSGCACSEKWGRPSTFALLFTRLGGHAPKSWTAAGLARAFFIRFYRFLGGYTPKKHWIFSCETGWSCSEFCSFSAQDGVVGTVTVHEVFPADEGLFLLSAGIPGTARLLDMALL